MMGKIENSTSFFDKIMEMVNKSSNQDKAVATVITTALEVLMQIQSKQENHHDVLSESDSQVQ